MINDTHRDIDDDGLAIEHDEEHVHLRMLLTFAPATKHPTLLFTPTVARAIAADLLRTADSIDHPGGTTRDCHACGGAGFSVDVGGGPCKPCGGEGTFPL
jgi:hypothetical protein